MNKWVIYALLDGEGKAFYVGFSRNHKRRLKEHRATYGRVITMEILQEGEGDESSWTEHEKRWIKQYRELGHKLQNMNAGGGSKGYNSKETRAKLSYLFKGRPVTWGDKIGAAMRGRPKNWSTEGRNRVEATQFKGKPSPEIEAKRKENQRIAMLAMSPEKRNAAMVKANKNWWTKATPEQRAKRTESLVKGRDPVKRSEISKRRADEYIVKHPEHRQIFGNRIKSFWANMTPEYRKEYLKRRGESIKAAKAAKKTNPR